MALTSFVANLTKITAVWLNKIDVLYVTVFGEAATKAAARAALTSDAPMAIGEGGTGATTAGAARTALGSTTVGDAVFIAATQADARIAIGAPAEASTVLDGDAAGGDLTGTYPNPTVGATVPVVLAQSGAVQIVANTAANTAIATLAVPGGTLGTNRKIRVELWGRYTNNTGVNRTLQISASYGGSNFVSPAVITLPTSINSRTFRFIIELQAANSAASQYGVAFLSVSDPVTVLNADVWEPDGFDGASYAGSSLSIDSTQARNLVVSIAHPVADANLTLERLSYSGTVI